MCQIFKSMRIGQIRDPSLPPADQLPDSYHTKVLSINKLLVRVCRYGTKKIGEFLSCVFVEEIATNCNTLCLNEVTQ